MEIAVITFKATANIKRGNPREPAKVGVDILSEITKLLPRRFMNKSTASPGPSPSPQEICMTSQNRAGLDEEGRRLLDEMVQNRLDALAAGAKTQIVRAPVTPSPNGVMDFQNLPGYRELKLQRSMAAVIGLDNPYFRLHETAAGATTLHRRAPIHQLFVI